MNTRITRFIFSFLSFIPAQANTGNTYLLDILTTHVQVPRIFLNELHRESNAQPTLPAHLVSKESSQCPLFKLYPYLKDDLAYISFGSFPTPVQKLGTIGSRLGHPNLYIKRDDLSGATLNQGEKLYGGNKVRKLEFLLADAIKQRADTVITFGGTGSNHALATAVYAQRLGLKSISILTPQLNSPIVQQNLLLQSVYGSRLYECTCKEGIDAILLHTFIEKKQTGTPFPYIIPTGGSSCIGAIGFVCAALELKQQILQGLLPEPDYIYLPVGSCGTVAGLLLGLKAVKLKSKIIAIRVSSDKIQPKAEIIRELFYGTNSLLSSLDPTFPQFSLSEQDYSINANFWGGMYGKFTQEGNHATHLLRIDEGIQLDGTYTAKAFAALIEDIKSKNLSNKAILFWNTYCGLNFDTTLQNTDHKCLPLIFHKYFQHGTSHK